MIVNVERLVLGIKCGKDFTIGLGNGKNWVCTIQTRKLSDALLISQIVTTSIEIDEITKQDNRAHE